MAYFLSVDSSIQSLSIDRQFSTLLREAISGIEADFVSTFSLSIPIGGEVEVPLGSIEQVRILAFKGEADFDVSLSDDPLVDVWSGFPSRYHLRNFATGGIIEAVKLKAATAVTVEVVIAGSAL